MRYLILFCVGFMGPMILFGQSQAPVSGQILEVVVLNDSVVQRVLRDTFMYRERWDTLAQIRFWRKVMNLAPEYSLLSIADTRSVLHELPTMYYDTLSDDSKRVFKDSLISKYGFPKKTRLYVTYGKSDYYQIRKVLPNIDTVIQVFQDERTDPWFGQAILLIESPGKVRQSPRGAMGYFQLMKGVAIQQGLVVNKTRDDRRDLRLSARAAARFLRRVCIPQVRRMMQAYRVPFQENELWFRLLVLHVYHAGAGNVWGVMRKIKPRKGGMDLIRQVWRTRYRGFGNASQNYSQIALASLLELDRIIQRECSELCGPVN